MSENIPLDSRVRDAEGACGTVRFVGSVLHAKKKDDIYVGVEWDSETRGKHDGSCVDPETGKMHRYFTCSATAGSFVKPSKLRFGRTFMEALKDRYVEMDAPLVAPDNIIPDAFVNTSKGTKPIELLGETKIRKWQQIAGMNKIAMRNDTISYAGEGLQTHVGHMVELDLQDNLISEWMEVARLVLQMPQLATLLLHGNKLQEFTATVAQSLPPACFQSLKVVALNGCGLKSWKEVVSLQNLVPGLEELYLSRNTLADLPDTSKPSSSEESVFTNFNSSVNDGIDLFPNLKVLDISGCGLTKWSQVLSIAYIPKLQDLLLDENAISSISLPPDGAFANLQRMSISTSKLSSWEHIDSLDKFPVLSYLRLSHVPLFKGKGASEVRPVVIGRMAKLKFFNGSMIQGRERMDSEKSYLRRIIRERADIEAKVPDVTALPHPRYEELNGKYGADLLDFGDRGTGPTLASDLVNIVFKNLSFSGEGSMEPVTKKIPSSLTIGRLKMMVKQLFKLEPSVQQLSLRNYRDSPPQFLDDDGLTLAYLGAKDDSVIFINETD
jgi:tubulin-specific chaperone E